VSTALRDRGARAPAVGRAPDGVDWAGSAAFFGMHAACLLALKTGFDARAALAGFALYWIRMFAITAGYHRYFSHRSYRTGRLFQFLLGWVGASSAQKGPLWWAAHHRRHHAASDQAGDIHSPVTRSFWWAHVGWVLSARYDATDYEAVPDLTRYPELVWLNRFHWVPPAALAVGLFACGGLPWLVWAFFVSTVVLYHGTFTINSLAHVFGSKRFETGDESRNNLWLALITMGEGWHNNHHRYPASERQGLFWWELDASHAVLRGLSRLGVVRDLREPPAEIYREAAGAARA
jgi:stearoyl-CoA desaturase (delta-9 desaturase)